MQIKTPRLFRNRCGVFYFRIKTSDSDRRFSLRTKCPDTAAIIALQLNVDLERKRAMIKPKLSDFNLESMPTRRYELDLLNGIARADGPEDHMRMMDAIDRIGMLQKALVVSTKPAPKPAAAPSMPLSKAIEVWLAERAKKNAPRTVDAKRYHMADFSRHIGKDLPINELTKTLVVAYKNSRLGEGQTGKTLDNKLMTLHDFFKYVIANALYTASDSNPVDGLFVLTKQERINKNEPYQPFTNDDLKAFFDPRTYRETMNAPDLFWAPLVAAYTGMRISEATGIYCEDIQRADNGVDYIFVRKSKSGAGVRNVPICDTLIRLGFLNYVEEVRASGAERLYPHRLEINHTYSKKLSEAMLEYQKAIGIKKPNDHKSFHSFRVNVITALANNGANTPQVMKIVGHKNKEGDEVHLGYVRDLPDLKRVVDALQWPIDTEVLTYDGRFKDFVANPKNWTTKSL